MTQIIFAENLPLGSSIIPERAIPGVLNIVTIDYLSGGVGISVTGSKHFSIYKSSTCSACFVCPSFFPLTHPTC